ncbi:LlaMI family restriction endonuclease [Halobacteriovorax sp. RT-2-4]|uniref:LlaMI family restriction endonuclease n=1 Tax=unclassified Halobacteriovorax TaxID=2639665 RepID=UPI00399A040A
MYCKNKEKIIEIFKNNVLGKHPDTLKANSKHCGSKGHWLERAMGIEPNADNKADILGYEMKNQTRSKTSFGDWSADWYIFKSRNNKATAFSRDQFLEVFGKPNEEKEGRVSWSGEPAPKIGKFNRFGQKLVVTESKHIRAIYSYSEDQRENKEFIVPIDFQIEDLVLAHWESSSIKAKLEAKFNQLGWFKCEYDKCKGYFAIAFGQAINYETWVALVEQGVVIFDSGMYQGNSRPYSTWRSNNNFWDSLITDRRDFSGEV